MLLALTAVTLYAVSGLALTVIESPCVAVKVFPSAYVVPLWVTVTVPPLGEPTVIV